ncbi:MAG: hypothetical protein GF418_14285 [Chitinivibrionales bacterium]|nr:hypothetical protein [Chitinivibrionales bacterium]MBD3396788.1 hypothetical protein [Chitinivibrionales bacterium]
MEKTFHFQPHIRYCEKPVMSFFAVLIAGSMALPVLIGPVPGGTARIVRLSFYLCAMFFCTAVLARMLCRRWKQARFVVTVDRLIYYGLFSVKVVSYAAVRKFWHVHFLYWAGFAVVRGEQTTIYLPFVVHDLSGLAKAVEERFKAHNREALLRSGRFDRFVLAARVNDIMNERIYTDLPALLTTVALGGIASGYVAQSIWRLYFPFVLGWSLLGLAFPLLGYLVANFIMAAGVARRIRDNFNVARSYDASALYVRAALVTAVVYLASGIAFRRFSTWLLW